MKKAITFVSALLAVLLISFNNLQGQSAPTPKVEVPVYADVSIPLKDMVPTTTPNETEPLNEEAEKVEYPFYKFEGPDPVWQKTMGTVNGGRGMTRSFAGTDCLSGLSPSDDNGDIGPNHYVQTVNSKLQIFDRAGTSLYGPVNINTLFTGIPGAEYNSGDPIVLYDEQANRWMISEFSVGGATKYMMIAVSTTADPLGTYNRWSYSWGASVPDYPKFGIWRDSYLLGLNCGTDDIAAFDRNQMLAGNASPQVVKFDNPWFPASGWHCAQPCDNDGAFAPFGTPGIFLLVNDGAWGGSDQMWVYSLSVNWSSPGTASFTRINTLAVTSFDSNFGGTWDNIPQPGTAQKIEVLSNLLMYRAQYRNFGTYQSIVCCHDVDVNGADHAGIRWYELRNTGAGWTVYQQSTYAPDANHRWMASISQNGSAEIALGFTVASSTVYPSIRYTGRTASDPLGTMTFAETTILGGTQSQTDGNRWGDYTSMSIDPNDDKTFWYTSQYAGGSAWNWHTRIASFKFDNYCTASSTTCDEYISRVQIGTIDNSSACDHYRDYSDISTDFPINTTKTVIVTNGVAYTGDQCGVWVDWNRDDDFADAGETMSVTGGPGSFSASITPPSGITFGPVRMRVRITYNTTPLPCGTDSYGEVEDYTLNMTAKAPNYWVGTYNHYWHNANNWSLGHIPVADEDAIITNAGYQPVWLSIYDDPCKNLTVQTGGTLEIVEKTITINGNLSISGTLAMTNAAGVITCNGDVSWNSGSTANFSASTVFWDFSASGVF
ncbi:MAG: GEVED domain-containing protein [Bacteroidetes bacterium]|nr:GEVED domain-containing protein [Bacteroidota bacterium]